MNEQTELEKAFNLYLDRLKKQSPETNIENEPDAKLELYEIFKSNWQHMSQQDREAFFRKRPHGYQAPTPEEMYCLPAGALFLETLQGPWIPAIEGTEVAEGCEDRVAIPSSKAAKYTPQEQLKNELLACMWRYSQESDLTILETIQAAHQAAERICQIALDGKEPL